MTCNLLSTTWAFVKVSLWHWDWPLGSFLMWTISCLAKLREHILDDYFGTSFCNLGMEPLSDDISIAKREAEQCHLVSNRVLSKAWLVLEFASRDNAACHIVKIL